MSLASADSKIQPAIQSIHGFSLPMHTPLLKPIVRKLRSHVSCFHFDQNRSNNVISFGLF